CLNLPSASRTGVSYHTRLDQHWFACEVSSLQYNLQLLFSLWNKTSFSGCSPGSQQRRMRESKSRSTDTRR
ncbi:mCG145094, partial [Mus musculus]